MHGIEMPPKTKPSFPPKFWNRSGTRTGGVVVPSYRFVRIEEVRQHKGPHDRPAALEGKTDSNSLRSKTCGGDLGQHCVRRCSYGHYRGYQSIESR